MRFERAIPVERLTMRPLSGAEVEALVRQQVVGVADLEPLVEQIQVASGGNALYATQLAAAAAAAGELPDAVPAGPRRACAGRGSRPRRPSGARAPRRGGGARMDVPARAARRRSSTPRPTTSSAEPTSCARAGLLAADDEHDGRASPTA